MKNIDYHGALGELATACNMAQADMAFVRNPLQGFVFSRLPAESLIARVLWKGGVFLRHVTLVGRLWLLSRHRMVLVREFSNLPLLTVCMALLPLRKRLVFTVNHNLQWAVRSGMEGFAFRMLDRLGFRFLFFETKEINGAIGLGVNSDRHWAVPHPVAKRSVAGSRGDGFTVGIVGHYRPEKGIDEVLDVLLAGESSFRLVVGVPNISDFEEGSKYGKGNSLFELRDTSAPETYRATLAECNVVLLCYMEEGYRFRASGIIADAASSDTAILAPRFPVLEHQVGFPVPIGECYSSVGEIPGCIEKMAERQSEYQEAMVDYSLGRSATALAKLFDELIDGVVP